MADHESIALLESRCITEGILNPLFEEEYQEVHENISSFIDIAGQYFSVKTLNAGEVHLRKWLKSLHSDGMAKRKLNHLLRCGLADLCLHFVHFTYESITLDELIDRTISSYKNREYQKAQFTSTTPLKKKKTLTTKSRVKKKKSTPSTNKKRSTSIGKKTKSGKKATQETNEFISRLLNG